MAELGFKLRKDVWGDGSCFFHAVIDQRARIGLTDAPVSYPSAKSDALELRQAAVRYFKELVRNYVLHFYFDQEQTHES